MAGIALSGLTKRFGRTQVLRGVGLDIADGAFVALLGPSGCGKTTLLRIIAGLETQDTGEVRIGGRPVDHLPPKARDLAMVFQSYALYPYMSVRQNIGLPLTMRRLSAWQRIPLLGRVLPGTAALKRRIAEEVTQIAGALDLSHLLERRPAQLSGGQRQRTALARAMVRNPAAFLMDEPLSNLDTQLRAQARAEIMGLQRRLGATVVYVTHDQAEALAMADVVVVMLDGRVHQAAPPQTVYDDPADLDVARFVGAPRINLLRGRVGSDLRVSVDGVGMPLIADAPIDAQVQVAVRPENLVPTGPGLGLPAMVRLKEAQGSETLVHVALPGQGEAILRLPPTDAAAMNLGARLHVRPIPGRVLVFDEGGRRLPSRDVPVEAERV